MSIRRPELGGPKSTGPCLRRGSSLVGLVTFIVGISMILVAFKLALDLFSVPPEVQLDVRFDKPIDASQASQTLLKVFLKIVSLLVMAVFGSMVANRGIKLHASFKAAPAEKPAKAQDHGQTVPRPAGQEDADIE